MNLFSEQSESKPDSPECGGGHMHAAGASVDQDVDAAREALLGVLEEVG